MEKIGMPRTTNRTKKQHVSNLLATTSAQADAARGPNAFGARKPPDVRERVRAGVELGRITRPQVLGSMSPGSSGCGGRHPALLGSEDDRRGTKRSEGCLLKPAWCTSQTHFCHHVFRWSSIRNETYYKTRWASARTNPASEGDAGWWPRQGQS